MKKEKRTKSKGEKIIIGIISLLIVIGVIIVGRYAFLRFKYHRDEVAIRNAVENVNANTGFSNSKIENLEKKYKVKPIGVIQIPKIKVNNGIVVGITLDDMFYGVGWDQNSPIPTLNAEHTGNLVLAAHDQGYAPIYENLPKLENGDNIYVYLQGNTFVYQVYNHLIVNPTDIAIANNQPDKSMLTTYTCTDGGNKRYVIQAKLVDRFKGTALMKQDKDKPIRDFNNGEDGPYLKALREGRVNAQGQIIS